MYVGATGNSLQNRFDHHRSDIKIHKNSFNGGGTVLADLRYTAKLQAMVYDILPPISSSVTCASVVVSGPGKSLHGLLEEGAGKRCSESRVIKQIKSLAPETRKHRDSFWRLTQT